MVGTVLWVQHSGGFFLGKHQFGLWSRMKNKARRALGSAQSHNSWQCFHFPSVLLSPSLEEGISGFFWHPAGFCSAAAAGKSSHCLHLRHNRVPQTRKLEQATPAPPAMDVFPDDLWKHLTADHGFGILGPRLLNSTISASVRTLSYQEPTDCFSEDCFLQTPLFVCPRVLASLEEPDI